MPSVKKRVEVLRGIQSQLKAIGGHDSDVLENLKPAVRKRVAVLRGIQSEHDELEAKFFEERAALEPKYQKLYAPLYSKIYDIVTGTVEVDGAKEEDAMDQTVDTEKGVPEFWLTAMKHNVITAKEIKKRDEEALKYLKVIKCMDDPEGFKLEFFFDTNPFFTNCVLTKVYPFFKMKAIGTTIEWLPGKCLTRLSKDSSRKIKSFFNFFSPNEDWLPGYPFVDFERECKDSSIGLTIRDIIIPHAVSWFMGEANPTIDRRISFLLGCYDAKYDEDDDDDDDDEIEGEIPFELVSYDDKSDEDYDHDDHRRFSVGGRGGPSHPRFFATDDDDKDNDDEIEEDDDDDED